MEGFLFFVILSLQISSAFSQEAAGLFETGLYVDPVTLTVAPGVEEYQVQYPLWSDGVVKRRWVYLPPSTKIDTSDGNRWKFPAGTKFWKEFAQTIDGKLKRIETRLFQLGPEGWKAQTFLWNSTGTEAPSSDGRNHTNYAHLGSGIYHHVPGIRSCTVCHYDSGATSLILGFSALQLDHKQPGLNLLGLKERGLLSHALPKEVGIRAATSAGKKAMGLLHGNCAHCHNPHGIQGSMSLNFKHDILTVKPSEERALKTTVNQQARFWFPDNHGPTSVLIAPGDPQLSLIYRRIKASAHTDEFYEYKMPPGNFGTMSVNEELAVNLEKWIKEMKRLR